jgi:cytoskeletal protein RodZ
MAHSKPVATCLEVIIITIICLLVGACLYISLQYNPAQNENTTKSIIPIKSVPVKTTSINPATSKSASISAASTKTASSNTASIHTVSFVPIQQPTTPNTQTIKLITIDLEGNR